MIKSPKTESQGNYESCTEEKSLKNIEYVEVKIAKEGIWGRKRAKYEADVETMIEYLESFEKKWYFCFNVRFSGYRSIEALKDIIPSREVRKEGNIHEVVRAGSKEVHCAEHLSFMS